MRRYSRPPARASLISSLAMRTIVTLATPLASRLYSAARTEGLLISVASTRPNSGASATVKLPLPQYSSSRSPPMPAARARAQPSILRLTPPLGWVKLPSSCW